MLNIFLKSLPYKVHTNRELGLLLSGQKPFANFADAKGQFPPVLERYLRFFDRQVQMGALVRRDHVEPPDAWREHELHRIMFAVPGEEWRFDAFLDLMQSPKWGPYEERRQGELLGYEHWMNDYWLELKYGNAVL